MNRLLFAAALTVGVGASAPAQSPVDSVRRADSIWARAYASLDTATINRVFAPDILVTTSAGTTRTRQEEIDDNRPTPGLVMQSFRTRNVDITVSKQAAVLTGDAQWTFTQNGMPQTVLRRYVATYARGGQLGWQMTALHFFPAAVTGVPVALPADAGVAGKWEGSLGAGSSRLRISLEITKAADGLLIATLRSLDQGGGPIPVERVTQAGDSVHVMIPVINGRYDAQLSADRTQLVGIFNQAAPLPLTLTRTGAVSGPSTGPTVPATPTPLGLLVDVSIPARPLLVRGGGKRHLIYELRIANYTGAELVVTRLEAVSKTGSLVSYEGAALNSVMMQTRLNTQDARSIPPGGFATAFLQITFDSGVPGPATIRHRLGIPSGTMELPEIPISPTKPIVVGTPFTGENWRAANGPGNASPHRRALMPIAGRAAIAQRFAIDWVKVGGNGATFAGDALDNKSYYAYGTEIRAVADGTVEALKDGIRENIPGATSRAVPITLETIAGNHIVQNLGGGRFALYAHLQPGTLRVKVGDRVRKGQVIGLLGNSGNSTEPHLHFHIMDGPSPLGSEGLPYVIDSWEARTRSGSWERRANEMPMIDEVLRAIPPVNPRKP